MRPRTTGVGEEETGEEDDRPEIQCVTEVFSVWGSIWIISCVRVPVLLGAKILLRPGLEMPNFPIRVYWAMGCPSSLRLCFGLFYLDVVPSPFGALVWTSEESNASTFMERGGQKVLGKDTPSFRGQISSKISTEVTGYMKRPTCPAPTSTMCLMSDPLCVHSEPIKVDICETSCDFFGDIPRMGTSIDGPVTLQSGVRGRLSLLNSFKHLLEFNRYIQVGIRYPKALIMRPSWN